MGSHTRHIVLTGPESSGKTTLALALGEALDCAVVPEFARTYLQYLGRPYTPADLDTIERGQLAWETWHKTQPNATDYIVSDTDQTVLAIWRKVLKINTLKVPDVTGRIYFLCAPDIPWEPDPLREHPNGRARLFEAYQTLLDQTGANFYILRGTPQERLQYALWFIRSS
jgi:nicotinamide riboside kinase